MTSLTPARILVFLVLGGILLGALGIYDPLFELFGCGVSVPLLGFGANVAKGVKEMIDNEGAIGILKGAFSSASAGCTAALIFGFLNSLLFKGKPKNI